MLLCYSIVRTDSITPDSHTAVVIKSQSQRKSRNVVYRMVVLALQTANDFIDLHSLNLSCTWTNTVYGSSYELHYQMESWFKRSKEEEKVNIWKICYTVSRYPIIKNIFSSAICTSIWKFESICINENVRLRVPLSLHIQNINICI